MNGAAILRGVVLAGVIIGLLGPLWFFAPARPARRETVAHLDSRAQAACVAPTSAVLGSRMIRTGISVISCR